MNERERALDQSHRSREHQWDDAWPSTEEGGAHRADEVDIDDEVMPCVVEVIDDTVVDPGMSP